MSGLPKAEAPNLVTSSMAPLSPTELLNRGVTVNVSMPKHKIVIKLWNADKCTSQSEKV